jgi:hypothetical protein
VRDPPERESVTNLLTLKRSKKINNELLVSDHPSTQNHNSHRGAPLNEINMPPKPFC